MIKRLVTNAGFVVLGAILVKELPRICKPALKLLARLFPESMLEIDAFRFHHHLMSVNADAETAVAILQQLPQEHQAPLLEKYRKYDPQFHSAIASFLESGSPVRSYGAHG